MAEIECFWTVDTGEVELSLRRWRDEPCPDPANAWKYCRASVDIGRAPARTTSDGFLVSVAPSEWAEDPRWPTACQYCGREFGSLTERVGVYRRIGVHTAVDQDPWWPRRHPARLAGAGLSVRQRSSPRGFLPPRRV